MRTVLDIVLLTGAEVAGGGVNLTSPLVLLLGITCLWAVLVLSAVYVLNWAGRRVG